MKPNLIEQIKLALSKSLNGKIIEHITEQTKLRDDLGLDSITSLTFLMALEEVIEGFIVDPDELNMDDLTSVKTIMQYINRQLREKIT